MTHGTLTGYTYHMCRCAECAERMREYVRTRRARIIAEAASGTVAVPHGTSNGYQNYGCRCEACREAQHAKYKDGLL